MGHGGDVGTNGSPVGGQQVDSSLYEHRISNDTMFIERPAAFAPDSYRDTAALHEGDSITVRRRLAKVNGFRPTTRALVSYVRR